MSNYVSKDDRWKRVWTLEDIQSVLLSVYKSLEVVRAHAHNHDPLDPETSFHQIHQEALEALDCLEILRHTISKEWSKIVGDIQDKDVNNILQFEDLRKVS